MPDMPDRTKAEQKLQSEAQAEMFKTAGQCCMGIRKLYHRFQLPDKLLGSFPGSCPGCDKTDGRMRVICLFLCVGSVQSHQLFSQAVIDDGEELV